MPLSWGIVVVNTGSYIAKQGVRFCNHSESKDSAHYKEDHCKSPAHVKKMGLNLREGISTKCGGGTVGCDARRSVDGGIKGGR